MWALLFVGVCVTAKVEYLEVGLTVGEATNGWSYTTEVENTIPTGCLIDTDDDCILFLPLWVMDIAYKSPMEDPTCPIEKAFIDRYIEVYRQRAGERVVEKRFERDFCKLKQDVSDKELFKWSSFGGCGNGTSDGWVSGMLRKKFPESCSDLTLELEYQFEQYTCTKRHLANNVEKARAELGRTTSLVFKSPTVKVEYAVEGWPCGTPVAGKVKGKTVKKMKMGKEADSCDCETMCKGEDGVTQWVFTGKGRKVNCECLTGVKSDSKKVFTGKFDKED